MELIYGLNLKIILDTNPIIISHFDINRHISQLVLPGRHRNHNDALAVGMAANLRTSHLSFPTVHIKARFSA